MRLSNLLEYAIIKYINTTKGACITDIAKNVEMGATTAKRITSKLISEGKIGVKKGKVHNKYKTLIYYSVR